MLGIGIRAGSVHGRTWAAILLMPLGLQGAVILNNFQGVTLNEGIGLGRGFIPPDTMGSVGPNHVAMLVNGVFEVYNRSGVLQQQITDNAFWSNAFGTATSTAGDPRLVYDPGSQRWFASAFTSGTNNPILLARSNSDSPLATPGNWQAVSFAGSASGRFADQPSLAVTQNAVVIGTNNFGGAGGTVSIFTIPKADLLAGVPTLANMTRFDDLSHVTSGYTSPQGALDFNAVDGSVWNHSGAFFGQLTRLNISGQGGAGATLSAPVTISIPLGYGQVTSARQPDGINDLESGDMRFSSNAFVSGSTVYLAHAVDLGSGRAGIRWYVIDLPTNAVTMREISDPNFDFFYPSIVANSFGEIMIGFSRSGPGAGDFISSYAITCVNNGAVCDSPMLLRQGLDNYHLYASGRNRWGDYSATVIDPLDPHSFWTFQEYADAPVGGVSRWATQVTQINFVIPEPSTVWLVIGGALVLLGRQRLKRAA